MNRERNHHSKRRNSDCDHSKFGVTKVAPQATYVTINPGGCDCEEDCYQMPERGIPLEDLSFEVQSLINLRLKVPVILEKESELPTECMTDGDYYIINDMDISAPGQTGQAWRNSKESEENFIKVIDAKQQTGAAVNMDNVSIVQNGSNAWEVSSAWLNGIIAAAVSNKLGKTETAADSNKLGGKDPSYYYSQDNMPPATPGGSVPDYKLDTEVNTGVKWHDGKTIYRRTFKVTSGASNNVTGTVATISDFGELVEIYGYIKNVSSGAFYALNYGSDISSCSCHISMSGTTANVRLRHYYTGNLFNNTPVCVTVEYTKA